LAGVGGASGDDAVGHCAARILAGLGARMTAGGAGELRIGSGVAHVPSGGESDQWLGTGFAADARPQGSPALFAAACAVVVDALTSGPEHSSRVAVDGPALLGERAALLELSPAGSVSAGGGARMLRTADGWAAVQLSRASDVDLVPALVADEAEVDSRDPWAAVTAWAARHPTAEVEERTELLGLAAAGVGSHAAPERPAVMTSLTPPRRTGLHPSGLVVNLGSLWAAPLAAQLLHRTGFRVVDVESAERPDGARVGTPEFYARLHRRHERVVLPLNTDAGRAELGDLLAGADVIITASRLAGLQRLGACPPAAPMTDQVWVAITGYGPKSNRTAFGDDAAAAGGLVARGSDGSPRFAGDALADPLTGLLTGVLALAGLRAGGSWRCDVALADVAAFAAALESD
jgi:hypothetical protein